MICVSDTAEDDEDEMPNLMELTINPPIGDPSSFMAQSDVNRVRLSTNGMFGPPSVNPIPLQHMTADVLQQDSQSQLLDQQSFVNPGRLLDLNSPPVQAVSVPTGPAPMEASNMSEVQNQGDAQNQPCKYDLLSSIPLTDLDLKFLYRGRTMDSLTVSNPQGGRLYYGHLEPTPEQVELFGPVSLQQVRFPGTSEIKNQKQRDYTEALLDVLDRGLILEIWEQDIYAVRLCQCKVFWSGPGLPEQGPTNPMERERRIKVFSLNDFLQGLISFQKGEAPDPPPFDIFFCFGEDWPDKKPKEKKLIIVQVVPVVARILTEMFSGELSWSTDSIRLQISHPDLKDQTVEQFKELQRLLQSHQIPGPWTPNVPSAPHPGPQDSWDG